MHSLETMVEIKVLARRGKSIKEIARELGVARQRLVEPVIRFETRPGQQMQADFIVMRRGKDRLEAFVATLGYSRMTFIYFVRDEKLATVLSCLRRAFEAFGGVPEHVLFDNIKTVVLDRDAYGVGAHRFHPQVLQLAKDLGFTIRLCRPYRAKTKGKVERFNRYLRSSFWVPLRARFKASGLLVDAETANLEVARWLREVANPRIHGDLKQRPVDRFEVERTHLAPYEGTVVNLNALSRSVPTPIESLQHPLSRYDALVVSQ